MSKVDFNTIVEGDMEIITIVVKRKLGDGTKVLLKSMEKDGTTKEVTLSGGTSSSTSAIQNSVQKVDQSLYATIFKEKFRTINKETFMKEFGTDDWSTRIAAERDYVLLEEPATHEIESPGFFIRAKRINSFNVVGGVFPYVQYKSCETFPQMTNCLTFQTMEDLLNCIYTLQKREMQVLTRDEKEKMKRVFRSINKSMPVIDNGAKVKVFVDLLNQELNKEVVEFNFRMLEVGFFKQYLIKSNKRAKTD